MLSDAANGATRSVRLRVSSPGATRGGVIFLPGAKVTAASANGKAIDPALAGARFRASNGWGLVYVDIPPEGVELALDLAAGAPLRVRVILFSRGVPDLVVAPRPPDVMPIHGGDQTLVAKTFTF